MFSSASCKADKHDLIVPGASSSSSSTKLITWEWREGSKWVKYGPTETNGLEIAYASCATKPQAMFIFAGKDYKIHFDTMKQENMQTKFKRDIRRREVDAAEEQKTAITSYTVPNEEGETKKSKGTPTQTQLYSIIQGLTSWKQLDKAAYQQDKEEKKKKEQEAQKKASSSTGSSSSTTTTTTTPAEEAAEACAICCCDLFDEPEDTSSVVVQICGNHCFHRDCLVPCYSKEGHFLKCPICSKVYGVRKGTQPPGSMVVTKYPVNCDEPMPLSGYSKVGTIVIQYNFQNGKQGPSHPNPGKQYSGTSRTAYLPDNIEGNIILKLLEVAWKRKLIFVIGTSVTTGKSDCVVWGGIHHKTSQTGGTSQFGYPDETYFERVALELASKGVTLEDIGLTESDAPWNNKKAKSKK